MYVDKMIGFTFAACRWFCARTTGCSITNLEMPIPSQGHYVFTVFRLLTDFVCLYTYEF